MIVNDTIATVKGSRACGSVRVPTSKSIAHRMLICAALAENGVSHISGVPYNDDIDATMDCLRALGVSLQEQREADGHTRQVTVQGCGGAWRDAGALDCRESGSTLRFMLPLCLLSDAPRILKGSTRLLQRPLDDYRPLFAQRAWDQQSNALTVGQGFSLRGGVFSLEGKTSSQFVTGLLFVLPLLDKDSLIVLGQAPESRSYIDMTLAVMARFGISARWQNETTIAVCRGPYKPIDASVDGDASGAAFFHALNALGGNVDILNAQVNRDIVQGDSICPQLLARIVGKNREELPTVSLADCPDLGPVLFAVAATQKGTLFTHTARLRLKESDRIAAMAVELRKFGVNTLVSDEINGQNLPLQLENALRCADKATLDGGWIYLSEPDGHIHGAREVLSGHNDHRIVMSLAVLAVAIGATVTIREAAAVQKSFPSFFDCLRELGVDVETNW